jgi:hypothetical protein
MDAPVDGLDRDEPPWEPSLANDRTGAASRPRRVAAAASGAGLLVACGTWPWILSGWSFFPEKSWDHDRFHLPLVRHLAREFPAVDLSDYGAATAPGLHLLLAAAAQVLGDSERMLQWLASLFGIALAATVAGRLAAWRGCGVQGFLLSLPLCLSPYLLGNSIWLMTDNLSLWLLAIVLLGAIFPSATPDSLWRLGIAAAAAAFVRQINLWVLPAIVAAGAARSWLRWTGGEARPAAPLLAGFAACLPALLVVGSLAWTWGGLVPPRFAAYHEALLQRSAPLYGLSLLAVYGAPLLLAFPGGGASVLRRPAFLLLASIWAVLVLVASDSYASLGEGRNGGWLWTLVGALPAPAGRSVTLAMLSFGGVVLLARLADAAGRQGRGPQAWLAILMLAAFLAAHAVNRQLFQRYFDPPILLTLAVLATLAWPRRGEAGGSSVGRNRWIVALLAMALLQLAFATATLFAPLLRNGPVPAERVIEGVLIPPGG